MPPAFVYQNILDIRHTKVEVLEIQLGRVEKKILDLENRKTALMDMKNNLLNNMQMKMQGEIDLLQLEILRSNLQIVDVSILRVDKEIDETRKNKVIIQKNLVEARQAEETLEILKEKGIEKFNDEMKSKENIQQDDIYISLAFRQNHQGI